MLRWRPAFAFLCSACLLALRLPPAAFQLCTEDGIKQVDSLISKYTPTAPDSQLYTPTTGDYIICPNATLACFASEINVLLNEWNPTPRPLRALKRLVDYLHGELSKQSNKVESGCPQCESHRENNATDFLHHLRDTFQYMNSNATRRSRKRQQKR